MEIDNEKANSELHECYIEKDGLLPIPTREYDRLKKAAEGNPEVCKGFNCEFQQLYQYKKWSWSHFCIGVVKQIFSAEFWIFGIVTFLFINFVDKTTVGVWIAYVALGGCFMFFKPLSVLITRGKLNVEAKLGTNLSANLTETINAKREHL